MLNRLGCFQFIYYIFSSGVYLRNLSRFISDKLHFIKSIARIVSNSNFLQLCSKDRKDMTFVCHYVSRKKCTWSLPWIPKKVLKYYSLRRYSRRRYRRNLVFMFVSILQNQYKILNPKVFARKLRILANLLNVANFILIIFTLNLIQNRHHPMNRFNNLQILNDRCHRSPCLTSL